MVKKKSAAVVEANGTVHENNSATPAAKKTECPITRDQFRAKAKRQLAVTIDGQPLIAEFKEFSTGSFGWYLQGKINVEIDGVVTKSQVSTNVIVVGSKEKA